jgi:hypothetical protein
MYANGEITSSDNRLADALDLVAAHTFTGNNAPDALFTGAGVEGSGTFSDLAAAISADLA